MFRHNGEWQEVRLEREVSAVRGGRFDVKDFWTLPYRSAFLWSKDYRHQNPVGKVFLIADS